MEQVHRHLRIRLGSMVAVGTAKGSCSTTVAMVSILVSTQGLIQAMVEGGTAVEAFVVLDEGTVGAAAADMDISAARNPELLPRQRLLWWRGLWLPLRLRRPWLRRWPGR